MLNFVKKSVEFYSFKYAQFTCFLQKINSVYVTGAIKGTCIYEQVKKYFENSHSYLSHGCLKTILQVMAENIDEIQFASLFVFKLNLLII